MIAHLLNLMGYTRAVLPAPPPPPPVQLGLWIYPDWLAADEAEKEAKRQHKATRAFQKAKREALHQALRGAR